MRDQLSADGERWPSRDEPVTVRQLAALAAWQERQHLLQGAAAIRSHAQHRRLELGARHEAARVEQAAILERSRQALERSAELVQQPIRGRVLLAHADLATVAEARQWLVRHDVEVIGACADGAEAVGVAVAECPDVVLVGFALRRLTCLDVVREISHLCPGTLVAAQAPTVASRKILVESGAQWVCSPALAGAVLAERLHALLTP